MKNYREMIWLKDIYHTPYFVLEGKLLGKADLDLISSLLLKDCRMLDCNHLGKAFALDADNDVIFSVLNDNFAICFHIEKYSNEGLSYEIMMKNFNKHIDLYVRKITELLESINEKFEFNVIYLEDPIKYT